MRLDQIVAQLESCGYTCEAGSLIDNMAFVALKELSEQAISVWEDATWASSNAGDAYYNENDPDWLLTIKMREVGDMEG
jgi:hypothetical protein